MAVRYYFKPLSRTIMQYADHLEHKFAGEVGVLEKKHVRAVSVIIRWLNYGCLNNIHMRTKKSTSPYPQVAMQEK